MLRPLHLQYLYLPYHTPLIIISKLKTSSHLSFFPFSTSFSPSPCSLLSFSSFLLVVAKRTPVCTSPIQMAQSQHSVCFLCSWKISAQNERTKKKKRCGKEGTNKKSIIALTMYIHCYIYRIYLYTEQKHTCTHFSHHHASLCYCWLFFSPQSSVLPLHTEKKTPTTKPHTYSPPFYIHPF